jgi:hypothetical protein
MPRCANGSSNGVRSVRLNLVAHIANNHGIAGGHPPIFSMEPIGDTEVDPGSAALPAAPRPFFPLQPTGLRTVRAPERRFKLCASAHDGTIPDLGSPSMNRRGC